MLVDPEPAPDHGDPAEQPTAHGTLHDPVRLFPGEAKAARHCRRRRLLQPGNGEAFEQQGEVRMALRPWDLNRTYAMRRAVNSWYRRMQQRLELARVQMAPHPLDVVMDRARRGALGTPEAGPGLLRRVAPV